MLDRITPSQRPSGSNDGTQTWECLLFAHWEIPIETLRPHIPAELKIDTFDGRAFVGVVPFKMRHIRPRWLPKFAAFNFLETNVRTYVIHRGRPGVYFFSLDANSRLAVWTARAGWSLPYYFAQMSTTQSGDQISYQSRRPGNDAQLHVSFCVDQHLGPSAADTLEHFLLERYLLFVKRRDQIHVGQVHHSPYDAHSAIIDQCHNDLISAAGLPAMKRPPDLTHYCPGVDVEVFGIQPVGG